MGRVDGKIAIVTGGTRGIGKAIARLLHSEGAEVVITGTSRENGKAAAEELGVTFLPQDVSREGDWIEVIKDTESRFGALNILVNNAAITGNSDFVQNPENFKAEEWQRIEGVNSLGTALGCKHAIPSMVRAGNGSIINISSSGAIIPSPTNTPYAAAKAGIVNLSMSVAMHCVTYGHNIRCNTVLPGGVRTEMFEKLFVEEGERLGVSPEIIASRLSERIPMKRFGQPEEIAYGGLYLASDEASYVNGTHLIIDGAATLNPLLCETREENSHG